MVFTITTLLIFGFLQLLYLDFKANFEKEFSFTEVIIRLSHDRVVLFKTFPTLSKIMRDKLPITPLTG